MTIFTTEDGRLALTIDFTDEAERTIVLHAIRECYAKVASFDDVPEPMLAYVRARVDEMEALRAASEALFNSRATASC